MKNPSGRVSIVIPTLNEADRLPQLLAVLARELDLSEIIVADGGRDDGTQLVALQLGAKVISTERGRGQALREEGVAASGDTLLFLHADSIFPPGGLAAVVRKLDRERRVVGGNFRVVFDVDTPFTRRLAAVYGWIRRFSLYYGDSGIFVRRKVALAFNFSVHPPAFIMKYRSEVLPGNFSLPGCLLAEVSQSGLPFPSPQLCDPLGWQPFPR